MLDSTQIAILLPEQGGQTPDTQALSDLAIEAGRPALYHAGSDERAVALSNSFGFGGHNVMLCLEVA